MVVAAEPEVRGPVRHPGGCADEGQRCAPTRRVLIRSKQRASGVGDKGPLNRVTVQVEPLRNVSGDDAHSRRRPLGRRALRKVLSFRAQRRQLHRILAA